MAQGLTQRNFHAHLQERKCERIMLELLHDQPYGPCQQLGPSEDHCLKNPTEIFIRDQLGTIWLCERKGDQRTKLMVNIRIIMEKYKDNIPL